MGIFSIDGTNGYTIFGEKSCELEREWVEFPVCMIAWAIIAPVLIFVPFPFTDKDHFH